MSPAINSNANWLAYIFSKQGALSPEDLDLFNTYCQSVGLNGLDVSFDHIKAITETVFEEQKSIAEKYLNDHKEWLKQFESIFKPKE